MAEALWSLRPPAKQASEPALKPINEKARERLARAIEEKLSEGYRVESQGESEATLVRNPRRWRGFSLPGRGQRVIVSLDQRGQATVQTRP
jgi:hypothetical protein